MAKTVRLEKYTDGKGNLAEIEEFDDTGPAVARLMRPGINVMQTWTVDDIRRPPIAIPPDVLYDRHEGSVDACLAWVHAKGFNVARTKLFNPA